MSTATLNPETEANPVAAAANKEEFGKAGEVDYGFLTLDQLHIDDELNARKTYSPESMEEMYESIVSNNGIYLPLMVAHSKPGSTKTDKPYTLVAGFRRAHGLEMVRDRFKAAGKDPKAIISQIPVTILKNVDVGDFHVVQLIENLVRKDLNPIEAGDAIERALNETIDPATGKKLLASTLAKQLGVSEGKVSQYRTVSGLPKNVKEAVAKGEITFANARIMSIVPKKHMGAALTMAKTLSAPEFEARVRSRWGTTGTEAGASTQSDATGSQKARQTRPAKEVRENYLPELKKRVDAAKNKAEKETLQARLDAVKWMLYEEGTELGKSLVDFERKLDAEETQKKESKLQENALTRLQNQLTSLMRKHINKPLEEGETKPTKEQALAVAMATVEKEYNKEAKTFPVAAGRLEQGKPVTYTQLSIPDLAKFKTDLLKHWGEVENKRKTDAAERTKKKEEEEAKAEEERKKLLAAGIAGQQPEVVQASGVSTAAAEVVASKGSATPVTGGPVVAAAPATSTTTHAVVGSAK